MPIQDVMKQKSHEPMNIYVDKETGSHYHSRIDLGLAEGCLVA